MAHTIKDQSATISSTFVGNELFEVTFKKEMVDTAEKEKNKK